MYLCLPVFNDERKMICKNCGTEFEGNFCNHCGQKSTVGRLTWKSVWDNLLHGIFHVDNTFVKTTRTLVVHPDRLISDYFAGRRKGYIDFDDRSVGHAQLDSRALYLPYYRHGSVYGAGRQDSFPQGRCRAVQLGRVSAGLLLPVGVVYLALAGNDADRVGAGCFVLYGVSVGVDGSYPASHLLGGVFAFPRQVLENVGAHPVCFGSLSLVFCGNRCRGDVDNRVLASLAGNDEGGSLSRSRPRSYGVVVFFSGSRRSNRRSRRHNRYGRDRSRSRNCGGDAIPLRWRRAPVSLHLHSADSHRPAGD